MVVEVVSLRSAKFIFLCQTSCVSLMYCVRVSTARECYVHVSWSTKTNKFLTSFARQLDERVLSSSKVTL